MSLNPQQFFHGTTAATGEITPGKHAVSSFGTESKAYATTSESRAWNYARHSREANPGAGYERVYTVSPKTDDVVKDTRHAHTDDMYGNPHNGWKTGADRYESGTGFDVVDEITTPPGEQGRLFPVDGKMYGDHNSDSQRQVAERMSRRKDAFAAGMPSTSDYADGLAGDIISGAQPPLPGLPSPVTSTLPFLQKVQARAAASGAVRGVFNIHADD